MAEWRQVCLQGIIFSKQLFPEGLLIVVKPQGKQYLGTKIFHHGATDPCPMTQIPMGNGIFLSHMGYHGIAWDTAGDLQTAMGVSSPIRRKSQ